MKIDERLAIIETEIKHLKKIVWVLLVAVLGSTGVNFI